MNTTFRYDAESSHPDVKINDHNDHKDPVPAPTSTVHVAKHAHPFRWALGFLIVGVTLVLLGSSGVVNF